MSSFQSIEIDFDVHKKIELERTSFAETPNAVLRRLLNIDAPPPSEAPRAPAGRPWSGKGVLLPHGTELRMEYNGRAHFGVIEDGEWSVEGGRYKSPSAAAGGVARTRDGRPTSLDGWIYWHAKLPDEPTWLRLSSLRSKKSSSGSPTESRPVEKEQPMATQHYRFNDLPTENAVIAELEDYLAGQPKPVSPTDAYRALADRFGLSNEQRHRMMPHSDEVHWENRVRQARRKLVNAGKLDLDLPRGCWGLRKPSERAH